MWRHYYANINAIIYVVDSNDRERLPEARDELHKMLEDDQLRNVAVLVFANKQDLPNAMKAGDLTEKLNLHQIRQRNWFIQPW